LRIIVESFFDFLEKNSLYIVLFITLTIWIGIFLHLLSVDKRLKQIQKEIREINEDEK